MFKYWLTLVIGFFSLYTLAQNSVGIGVENPNPNAVLELVAPNNDQGFLVPRLTTAQRTANTFLSNLSSEDNGLLVYDIQLNRFFFWINGNWQPVSPQNSLTAGAGISITDNVITNTGDTDTENEIQDLELDGSTLRITNNASATDIDLSPFAGTNTDEQDLGFNGSEITITNGNNVDISSWDLDASDDFDGNYNNLTNLPTLFSGNFSDLAGVPADLANGDDVDDADANPNNEIQDLELDGSTLRITNNASATDIDLAPFAGTNTDEQDLGFNGSEITITNGNNVNVSSWDLDASDDFDGNYNNLTNLPTLFSGDFSDLAGVPADLANGDDVDDADANPNNEIQDLELDGSTLRITNNASATDIDLAPFAGTNTDEQDLGFNGSEITITNGNNVNVSSWDLDASDDFDGNYNNLTNLPTLFSGNFSDLAAVPAELVDGDDVDDADANPNNEIQDLELDGSTLRITNNASATDIDLAPFAGTNTDEQDLGFNGSEITITNGNNVNVSSWDLDASDDFDGNYNNLINLPTLFSGNFSDLAGVPTNLDLDATDDFDGAFGSLSGVPAGLADGDNVNDADASITNEIQDLELDGSTLRITNNSSATDIDLSPFAGTNTDEQDLGFNGSEITITNGDNVDVSGWDLDASDDFDGAFGSLSGVPAGLADGDDINDADADPNNETITNLNLDGTNLEITEAGSTSSINLAGLQDGIGTDDQNLSLASTTLNIEGGSGVDLDGTFATDAELTALDTDDADADPANETITNLDLDGTNLEITEAGNTSSIDLAGLQDGIGTDNQTLSLNPDPQQLVISGGNALDITGWDLDTSDDFFLPATESFNTGDNILDLTNNGGGITAVFDRNNNAVSNPTLRSFNGGLGPAAEFDQARDGNGDIIVAFRDQGNLVASVNDLGQFVGDGSQLTNLPATLPNQSGNSGRFLTTDGSDASWANVPSSQWSGTNSISFTGEDAAVNAGSSSNPGFSVNRTGTSTNNVGLSINNLVTSPINSPSDKIGLQIISTGAFGTEGGTNIGLDVNVSGGNAQNIAAQFDGGNVVVSNGELRVEETVRISNNTATNFPLFFIDGNFSGDAAMRFSSSNTFTMGVDGSDNIFKISDWTSLGTNDRLSINSGGQVGIGTSSLSSSIKMEIENTERYSLWLDNNYTGSSDNYAVFVPNMTGFGSKYAFYQSGTTDENYFAGNVGIGTTDAARKLEVSGTGTQYARITSTSGYPGLEFNTNATNQDWRLSPSAFNSMRVDAGDVDGSMTTVATFWNFSTTLRGILPGSSNTFDLGATSTRWRTIYLVNNPSVSSDQRLKSNIKELDYGLEKILNLKPVSYKMKGQEYNKTHLGLIAQELREVIPEVVHEDNTADKLLSVTYSELIPVTIKAIQEQQNTIKSLERELEELRQKLADSEKYKASLKSQLNEQSAEIDMIKKAIGLQANAKVVNKK